MRTHRFTIIAIGLDPDANDFEDRFIDAGCDDATIAFQRGVIAVEFERQARTYAGAVASALGDVRKAGARVVRVEPDCLVNLSEIATRANLTRAAVSLFAHGRRGRGFPAPVARITTDTPLWDWVEVARWMHRTRRLERRSVVEARVTKAVNAAIAGEAGRRSARWTSVTRTGALVGRADEDPFRG